MFGDNESFMNDDVPVVISRKATGDWDENSGLGISSEEAVLDSRDLPKPLPPHLLHQESAPGQMEHKLLLRQRSTEKMRAKRVSIEKHRHECAESGDDEDEELGDVCVREKTSPRSASKTHRGSKLGTEMMRTNSRGSVVSSSDVGLGADAIELPPTVAEENPPASEITGATLTPPEVFKSPGSKVAEIDLDETPKPSTSHLDLMDEEPTPRAPSVSSNHEDYLMARTNSRDKQ
jgi:serine/threonine-protein kinase RIM15